MHSNLVVGKPRDILKEAKQDIILVPDTQDQLVDMLTLGMAVADKVAQQDTPELPVVDTVS